MPSLLNGLSQAGAGLADFAAKYGAEAQKADVAQQLQQGQQTFLGGENEKTRQQQLLVQQNQQGFETGLVSQRAALEQQQAILADRLATARESAGREQTARLQAEAPAPEIKSARQFAVLNPDEKKAYREEMMTKAGLPPWMLGDDQAGGPALPAQSSATPPAPTDTAVTGAPATQSSRPGLNEGALAKLPSTAQSLVKGMVDGRITPPSSFAAAKPYWQNLIQMATTYDPSFDETTWAGRVAMRKSAASGPIAQTKIAINTALSHAGTLADDLDKLGNTSVPALNYVLNNAGQALGGSTLTKAIETRDALASEARKVFSASGAGNLTELQEWQKNFPVNGSPAQQKASLVGFVELLNGRLQAVAEQYNTAMGKTDDPLNFLSEKSRKAFLKLSGKEPEAATGYQTGKPPADAAAAPAAVATLNAEPPPAPVAGIPAWVKPGDQFSPSRGMARGADGKIYGPS